MCAAEVGWLPGSQPLSVDVRKRITGFAFCLWLLSNKMEKHLWAEEIMVEKRHCHHKCQKDPICTDFPSDCHGFVSYAVLRSYFQWRLLQRNPIFNIINSEREVENSAEFSCTWVWPHSPLLSFSQYVCFSYCSLQLAVLILAMFICWVIIFGESVEKLLIKS